MSTSNPKKNDPNGVGIHNGNIFGLPYGFEESEIVIFPVPWDVTTSYRAGTAKSPSYILEASPQLDLYHPDISDAWKKKIHMLQISDEWKRKNKETRILSEEIIRIQEQGASLEDHHHALEQVNETCEALRKWVFEHSKMMLDRNKKLILVGGEHSVPLGYIQALSLKYESFGILQIDAHADLRDSYEGFTYSHASIMHQALKNESVEKLVQIGIRDLCEEEAKRIREDDRIVCFFDKKIRNEQYRGKIWKEQVDEIIAQLPDNIYLSLDVDGLMPQYCPNTGTPVPGGFDFNEVVYLLEQIAANKKKMIGIDICETGPSEWDGNVSARLLWQICCLWQ